MMRFSEFVLVVGPYLAIYFVIVVPQDRGPRARKPIHVPLLFRIVLFPFNWREERHDGFMTALAVPCILGSIPLIIIYIISIFDPTRNYRDLFDAIYFLAGSSFVMVIWGCMLIGFHEGKDAKISEKIILFILIVGCGIAIVLPILIASVTQTIRLISGLIGW